MAESFPLNSSQEVKKRSKKEVKKAITTDYEVNKDMFSTPKK